MATELQTAARSMGHMALHYGQAKEGPAAARLMSLLGFQETQVIPLPSGNFYRFIVDGRHYSRGDGLIYLSALPDAQRKLIDAISEALKVGTSAEHEAVSEMRAMLDADPEYSFHVGFLVDSLEALEAMVLNLRQHAETDPELKGRIKISMNRARPGDAEVDARLDMSPLFGDVTRCAYGQGGVQVFIETDLIKAGQLGDCIALEFDYVFPGHDSHILSVVEL